MLSPLGQRFVYSAQKLKNKVLTLPALIRELNARKRDFEELIARAKSFTSLLSVSSGMSHVIEHGVSGIDNVERVSGPSRIRSSKTDLATTVIQNFHTPNRQEIYKNSKLADDIEAALESINDLIARLKEFPKDERTTAELKHLTAYKTQLRDSMNEIVGVIGEFYEKHVPALYEDVLEHALTQLNALLPEDSYEEMSLVDQTITSHDTFAGKKDAAIEFTTFVEIRGLNPAQFKTSELYIAITGVVHESKTVAHSKADEQRIAQFQRKQEANTIPKDIIELVRERSTSLQKNHKNKVKTIEGKIKQLMTAKDPKFAKLMNSLEVAETKGKDTSAILVKIDEALRSLYEKVVLLDAPTSIGVVKAIKDEAYQKLLDRRKAAAARKNVKPELLLELDRKLDAFLASEVAEQTAERVEKVQAPRNTRTVYHMAFYVTALTKVRGPGMFDPGTELGGNSVAAIKRSLNKELHMLLSLHTSAPIIGKLPINMTTQQLRHSPLGNVSGVNNITVKDDVITITTSTFQEDVVNNTIIPDVLLALKSMFRTNKQTRFYIAQELKGTGTGIILKATYVKS